MAQTKVERLTFQLGVLERQLDVTRDPNRAEMLRRAIANKRQEIREAHAPAVA